jgi:hypothetical protein
MKIETMLFMFAGVGFAMAVQGADAKRPADAKARDPIDEMAANLKPARQVATVAVVRKLLVESGKATNR